MKPYVPLALSCAVAGLLAACGNHAGTYPELQPTAQMLTPPDLPAGSAAGSETEQIEARAAALRARAKALQNPVIPAPARQDMQGSAERLQNPG